MYQAWYISLILTSKPGQEAEVTVVLHTGKPVRNYSLITFCNYIGFFKKIK